MTYKISFGLHLALPATASAAALVPLVSFWILKHPSSFCPGGLRLEHSSSPSVWVPGLLILTLSASGSPPWKPAPVIYLNRDSLSSCHTSSFPTYRSSQFVTTYHLFTCSAVSLPIRLTAPSRYLFIRLDV